MTAVVTGSAGFIGQALVRALLLLGESVIGIDRNPQPPPWPGGAPTGTHHAAPGPRCPGVDRTVTALTAELRFPDELVTAALTSADVVFHLAGCPGVRDGRPDVALRRHQDNVLATAAVLAAVPRSTPLLVASSSSVYGGVLGRRPCAENDPVRPRGGYAHSKATVEALCGVRRRAGGLVTVVRPFTVAGEGQRPDMALARWIGDAAAGRPLRLFGSPERTRDVTDVNDVARVMLALARAGADGVFNVGTGVGHSLRAMVDAVAAALDTEVRTSPGPAHPDEVAHTRADTRKLRHRIGFVPHTDLRALVTRQAVAALGAPIRVVEPVGVPR